MLLSVFFIIGSAVYRGLLNYIILNAILNILLIISIIMSNSLILILCLLGKIGFYPFFLLSSTIIYIISYKFLLYDIINKQIYINCFSLILNNSIYLRCSEY